MSLARLIRPTVTRVRAPRVFVDLEVESRTIGTQAAYKMSTLDVSRSGLLLSWERDSKMPFNVNTIIEMTIDPGATWLQTPVACLGKVVRREQHGAEGQMSTQLGIQIVQIDNTDLSTWEGCLSELERKLGLETSNKLSSITAAKT
jgi:hypothetical protein